jgi:hypothetical protein
MRSRCRADAMTFFTISSSVIIDIFPRSVTPLKSTIGKPLRTSLFVSESESMFTTSTLMRPFNPRAVFLNALISGLHQFLQPSVLNILTGKGSFGTRTDAPTLHTACPRMFLQEILFFFFFSVTSPR